MPNLPISQLPLSVSGSSDSLMAIVNYDQEVTGKTYSIYFSSLTQQFSGQSGLSGISGETPTKAYGSFISLSGQIATSTIDAYSMSADTTVLSSGVTVVDGCKFTVASGGTYNIQFSAQIELTQGGQTQNIDIWFEKNAFVANNYSNTRIALNSNNGKQVAAWNFVENLLAGEFIEIKWSVDDIHLELVAEGSSLNPIRPSIPSVIVTVTQV
jgi:hypothetical protein